MGKFLDGIVSEADKKQFQDEGYMILKGVIPEDMLQMLREECSYFMGYFDAQLDTDQIGEGRLSVRDSRYFVNNRYRHSKRLHRFIFSDLMAEVAYNTLGENAVLMHEQWVVKGPEQGMKFSWHQDSGYVKAVDKNTQHTPYITCWCTLDDMTLENGTAYILPHSRGGTKDKIITHWQDPDTNDLVGYDGDDPGEPALVPAGSIVIFTSYVLHRSGSNLSSDMRRVYLPQYASEAIVHSQSGDRLNMNVPFLKNGEIVYDHQHDVAANWGGSDHPNVAKAG